MKLSQYMKAMQHYADAYGVDPEIHLCVNLTGEAEETHFEGRATGYFFMDGGKMILSADSDQELPE